MEFVQEPIDVHPDEPSDNEGGVRLFRKAPPGIVFEYTGNLILSPQSKLSIIRIMLEVSPQK